MKKFLTAFAAVAAGFVSQSASAAISQGENNVESSNVAPSQSEAINTDGAVVIRNDAGDQFNFVLKRSTETNQLMAYHSSHASHASHSSHYSSR